MRSPLLLVVDPAQISSGVQPDRHKLNMLLWEQAQGVSFYSGKVKRKLPAQQLFQRAGPVRGLSQQQDSDGIRWLWSAHGPVVGRSNLVDPYEELFTFPSWQENESLIAPATFIDLTHWGDWTILNSGIGAPRLHRPGLPVEVLENAPTDVVKFMKKQNFLLAIGFDFAKKTVGWSDADVIDEWETLPTNLAGSLPIEELDTPIRSAERLGQHIAVYAEDQLALMTYIGQPFIFGARVVLDGIGAVGKMAVCSDGRNNYGVSRNGIWRTDGNTQQYIDQAILHDYLQEEVNWAQASKIVAARDDVTGCFNFYFPMRESLICNEGWSFDPQYGGWSPIPAAELAIERVLFNKPLLGTANGRVLLADSDPEADLQLWLETKPMLIPAETPTSRRGGKVDEIEFMLREVVAVEFSYGVAQQLEGGWSWSSWQKLELEKIYKLERQDSGVFHKLRLRSTKPKWELDLQGFALFGVPEGTRF